MKNTHTLRIAIPTYNRCVCLKTLLESIWRQGNNKGIGDYSVYVYDNNSSDSTEVYCKNLQCAWRELFYIKRNGNIGGSRNIVQALQDHGACEYIWLLSDHVELYEGAVNRLLDYIGTQRRKLIIAGIDEYDNAIPIQSQEKGEHREIKETANLYIYSSNIASIVAHRALIQDSANQLLECAKLSYPHLGLWGNIGPETPIGYVPKLMRFQAQRKARDYAWFQSGVLDFGQTVSVVFPSRHSSEDIRQEIIKNHFFRKNIIRYMFDAQLHVVPEQLTTRKLNDFKETFPSSKGLYILMKLILGAPWYLAAILLSFHVARRERQFSFSLRIKAFIRQWNLYKQGRSTKLTELPKFT